MAILNLWNDNVQGNKSIELICKAEHCRLMTQVDARKHLLRAATRLFAERGIDAVSLREINLAAKQRNVAAVHYHFGSKEGLVEAIIETRMEDINARRMQMLDALDDAGRRGDLHSIVAAMVLPLAEQLDSQGESGHYIRLLAQVYGDPRVRIASTFHGRYGQSVRRIEKLVQETLVELPEELVTMRLALATNLMIHALADWEVQLHTRKGRALKSRTPLYVSNLVDSMSGALCAPVSQATISVRDDEDLSA